MADELPPGDNAPWYGTPDPETLGYLQARGLDKMKPNEAALAAVKAHREAEKLIGAPADQIIRLPKDANDVEGWNKVNQRLGTPADPKEYDFAAVKRTDGSDLGEEEVEAIRAIAHELQLPKGKAAILAQRLAKIADTEIEKGEVEYNGKIAAETEALKTNWGNNFAANKVVAENTAKSLGVSAEELASLERGLGYAKVMEMFRQVGTKIGEDKFVQSGGGNKGPMTKDEAAFRLSQLEKDSIWWDKFNKGDVMAVKEFNDLTRIQAGL